MIGEKLNDAVIEFEEEIEKLKSANAMYGEIQNLSKEIQIENQTYKRLIEELSLLSKEVTSSLKKGNTLLKNIEKLQRTIVKDINESIEKQFLLLEQNLKTQLEIQDKKTKRINLFVIINLLLVITNIIIAFIK